MGFFQYWACFLNFPFFHYSRFLALQGRFLNFSRFSPWFLKFCKKKKKLFLQKQILLYCTFLYILVTPPIILTFWLNGPWPLHCNQLCELFWYYKERKNSNGYFFFCFLTWLLWVLRFLFPWTFTNSFLRPKKPTIAFLKFSKIWV